MPEMLENEEIKFFLRKHLIFLISPLAAIAAMIIFPIVGVFVLVGLSPTFTEFPVKNFMILIMSIYILILCGSALYIWFRYYYSYLIITNYRFIEIEQKSIFDRSTAELELLRVEDVKALVRGILATFLRYGDVLVETAGATENNFLFRKVPNASYVGSQILELSEKAIGTHEPSLGGRAVRAPSQDSVPEPPQQIEPDKKNLASKDQNERQEINMENESIEKKELDQTGIKSENEGQGGILYKRDENDNQDSSGSNKISGS